MSPFLPSSPFPTPNLTGSKVIVLAQRLSVVGYQYILSDPLPYPATIAGFTYIYARTVGAVFIGSGNLHLIRSDSPDYDPQATVIPLTERRIAGTVPPDMSVNDSALPLIPTDSRFSPYFPVSIELPSPGWRLLLTFRHVAAGIDDIMVWVTVNTHTIGAGTPDQRIFPRGTEQEPVCVRVCPPDGPPIGPPTPGPPFPPPPEPPPTGPPDILDPPLPPPTDVTANAPLASMSVICELTQS